MSTVAFATSPSGKYGASFMPTSPAAPAADSQLPMIAGAAADDATSLVSPGHPIFWLGVILAGAVGLAYFSTTVRVGPVEAAASIGKK